MITIPQAEQDGYTFDPVDGGIDVAFNGDHVVTVYSDCPQFFALRHVAEILGDDLATATVTAALVQQTTGETYIDPPPPPPPTPTVQEKVAAALQQIQQGDGTQPVTGSQLASVIQALTS